MHTNHRRENNKNRNSYFAWTGAKKFRRIEEHAYRALILRLLNLGAYEALPESGPAKVGFSVKRYVAWY